MKLSFLGSAFALLVMFAVQSSQAAWILKRIKTGDTVTPVGVSWVGEQQEILLVPKVIKSFPAYLAEGSAPSKEIYEEVLWPYEDVPAVYAGFAQSTFSDKEFAVAGTEVRTIVNQGPAQNRICLTFTGDGYTEAEKEKFFADVARLVDDLFNGKTFASYTSLFNVYAVFVPSQESGITDLTRKNTAFGLYRDPAGSKRAIMPGSPNAINRAIALAPKTDYPIVVANDEFYGGLGGRYAITTRSIESGKIVLRHELGHNFGEVGEEYDNGYVYSGANASRSPSNLGWKHWVKENPKKSVQDMRLLGGAYVWQNLKNRPVVQEFEFPAANGKGAFWFDVQISSVGWQTLNDVEILLDGRKLELVGIGTSDRSFFSTRRIQDLAPGKHTLSISEVNPDGDNVLAFANLYAYEADYEFEETVSAFKTYDDYGNVSYRPTHDQCLMRNMLYDYFCAIDQENMWIQFLERIRIIDSVNLTSEAVELAGLKLDGLEISWFRKEGGSEVELTQFRNQPRIAKDEIAKGRYIVRVNFKSPEVRRTSSRLQDSMNFEVL